MTRVHHSAVTSPAQYLPRICGQAKFEIERARSAWQLIGATFALYRRYPWLFLVLAAVVVVPFDAVELLIEIVQVLHGALRTVISLALFVADFALVLPLISALHVHAVADVREGREPQIGPVARRGVATLPVLSRAAGFAYIGTVLGLFALIAPGVILALEWAVVAQVATLGAKSRRDALAESKFLTNGWHWHIFGLFLVLFVLTTFPSVVLLVIFGRHELLTRWVIAAAIGIPISSFTALAVGLLYYDLLARRAAEPVHVVAARPDPESAVGDPFTPLAYTDESRPQGWYVDPKDPRHMRYWLDGWSTRTAKTRSRTFDEWEKFRKSEPE